MQLKLIDAPIGFTALTPISASFAATIPGARLALTSIRRVIRRQYYKRCKNGKWKKRYDRIRHLVEFPADFIVDDLVGREVEFLRIGDELRLKPK